MKNDRMVSSDMFYAKGVEGYTLGYCLVILRWYMYAFKGWHSGNHAKHSNDIIAIHLYHFFTNLLMSFIYMSPLNKYNYSKMNSFQN